MYIHSQDKHQFSVWSWLIPTEGLTECCVCQWLNMESAVTVNPDRKFHRKNRGKTIVTEKIGEKAKVVFATCLIHPRKSSSKSHKSRRMSRFAQCHRCFYDDYAHNTIRWCISLKKYCTRTHLNTTTAHWNSGPLFPKGDPPQFPFAVVQRIESRLPKRNRLEWSKHSVSYTFDLLGLPSLLFKDIPHLLVLHLRRKNKNLRRTNCASVRRCDATKINYQFMIPLSRIYASRPFSFHARTFFLSPSWPYALALESLQKVRIA